MEKNYLYGEISWNSPFTVTVHNKNNFCFNNLKVTVNRLLYTDSTRNNYYIDDNKDIFVVLLGYIQNLNEAGKKHSFIDLSEPEIIHQLYCKYHIGFLNELEGLFLIFLYDYKIQKGYILQSHFGGNLPFYYYLTDSQMIFGTRLRTILPHLPDRQINIPAARDFLHFTTLIPNNQTLINSVFKLTSNSYLEIDCDHKRVNIKRFHAIKMKPVNKTSGGDLIRSIEITLNNILQLQTSNDVALTHTSGWDSNLLLFLMTRNSDRSITTVTVNGGDNVNEVPVSVEIQKNYSNLKSLTCDIKGDINSLVELVWSYEGYIFQEGMFLRKELANLLHDNNLKALILGACGDQILYPPNFIKRIIRSYPWLKYFVEKVIVRNISNEKLLRRKIQKTVKQIKFNMDIEMLIKMHEILLNEYGIQGFYPFLNQTTYRISRKLGLRNRNKRFYKNEIRRILPENILRYLAKSSNVVNTQVLFKIDAEAEPITTIMNSELIRNILGKDQIIKILKNPDVYHLLILQVIYIFIFNALFVSGKFDSRFNDRSVNLSVEEIVQP